MIINVRQYLILFHWLAQLISEQSGSKKTLLYPPPSPHSPFLMPVYSNNSNNVKKKTTSTLKNYPKIQEVQNAIYPIRCNG